MAKIDYKEVLLKPIFKGNPVTVLVLGICSSLAVTVQLEGALVMGISGSRIDGNPGRPGPESLYVQYKQGPVGICRTYHH